MSEISLLVEKQQLHELKSQCGGLQTLLKNHGHIFEGNTLANNHGIDDHLREP